VSATPAPVPEERTVAVPWRAELGHRAWSEKEGVALRHSYLLGESSLVWLEAEGASAVAYRDAGAEKADAQAGGGKYVLSPERLEFFFNVKQPGKFWTWYRVRVTGEKQTIRHLEGVDACYGASVGWVIHDIEPGKWVWVRREGPGEYKEGLHELQMDQWTPGVQVDRIALSSDEKWTPPADAPGDATAPTEPWPYGVTFTTDQLFASVLKWNKAEFAHSEKNGGKVGLYYSTDQGKTWPQVPKDGDLSALPVKSDGTDRIRFRVDIHRAPDGASPVVGAVRLTYTGDKDDLFVMEDKTAKFYFAKKTGALCGIVNKVTGTELTPFRRPQPIFEIRLSPHAKTPSKDWPTITSFDTKCLSPGTPDKKDRTRRFVYEIERADGKATVTLFCTQTAEGELTWTMGVNNELRDHDIVEMTYPIVDNLKTSEIPSDDTLLIWGGYLVKNPSTFGRFLYYWPTLTAPLMDVFGKREGVTVVAHDKTMRSTGISSMGQERKAVQLSLIKYVRVKPGKSFAGAPHLVRVHQGDWHTTGLVERKWLSEAWPAVQPALWMQESDGWVPAGWPIGWWSDLGRYAEKVKADTGFPYIQYWNFQVPGTTWTIPHPNPVNGSEDELKWGIDQIHRAGMRATFYIQGLLCDPNGDGSSPDDKIGHLQRRHLWPGWELPEKGFTEKWAAKDEDDEARPWSGTEMEMCYASKGFQEYKRHWAIDLFMTRLGLDGIYWDSLSRGRTCWATDHGHGDDPGMWGIGAQENHRLIHAQGRKLKPDAVFSTEGPPVDTLGAITEIHLNNAPSLDAVRFLFPKMQVYLGAADGADVKRTKSFLYGCRFDGIDVKDPNQMAMLRVRRVTKQFLYPAIPMDTMGLKIEGDPSVKARLFLCDPPRTRGAVATILNEQKASNATVTVDTSQCGPIKSAWLADTEGNDRPMTDGKAVDGGKGYQFPVPVSHASTVMLFNRAEPRVTVETETSLLPRGGVATVTVRLESLTGESMKGSLKAVQVNGCTGSSVPFTASDFGDKATVVKLSVTASDTARVGLVDIPVEIAVTGGPTFRKVATFYIDQPVSVTPTWVGLEKLRVTVKNGSLSPRGGTVSLAMASGEVKFQGANPKWTYFLKPGESQSFDTALAGGYTCQVPWAVKGTATCGKESFPVYTPFRPPILNGSMERCEFRKDVPDYWWGTYVDRRPSIFGTGEFSIDESVAAEGTHSFKVVGNEKEWRAANLDTILKPVQRYRFHARIRRTANHRNIFASIVEVRRKPDGSTEIVGHAIGQQNDGPLNEWQTYETTFTSLPLSEQAGCRLYLYNMDTPATVWFDDIRLVPEE